MSLIFNMKSSNRSYVSVNTIRQAVMFINIMLIVTIFQNNISTSLAATCDLCPDGSYPPVGDGGKFTYTKGGIDQTVTCDQGYYLAQQGEFADCDELHANAGTICGCNDQVNCTLCSNGELPDPDRQVAGKTCRQWENERLDVKDDDAETCLRWRQGIGAYCGCDISQPGFFDGFCRICGDYVLPNYNKMYKVSFSSGTTGGSSSEVLRYCALTEQEFNADAGGGVCLDLQSDLEKACGCAFDPQYPTFPPSIQSSSDRLGAWYYERNVQLFLVPTILSSYVAILYLI